MEERDLLHTRVPLIVHGESVEEAGGPEGRAADVQHCGDAGELQGVNQQHLSGPVNLAVENIVDILTGITKI